MIQKIAISNFKVFKDFACDLTEGVSLIAGQNNSGKTSLLQAIAWWSEIWDFFHSVNTLQGNPIEINISAFKSIPISNFKELWHDGNTNNPITIQVEMDQGNLGFEIRYQSSYDIDVLIIEDTEESLQLLKGNPIKVQYITPYSAPEIYEYSVDYQILSIRLAHGKGGSIIRNLLLEASKDDEKWNTLQNTVDDFFGYELGFPSGLDPIRARYRHSPEENYNNLINGASGFLQVVFLQSVLVRSSDNSILLIDEPDIHLHNLLKEKIYRLICKQGIDKNCQVIIASHSSRLIDEANKDDNLFLIASNRLNKVNRQTARDVVTIPTQHFVHAEINHRVLYLEDNTDKDILLGWAKVLNHPAQYILDRVFCVTTARMKLNSKSHFQALRAVVPNLLGLEIRDSDGKTGNKQGPKGMKIEFWERYEIENYLIHPDAMIRYISQTYGKDKVKVVENHIKRILPGDVLDDPLTDEIEFHDDNKGKNILARILKLSGINLPESKLYTIAEVMKTTEIHPDVTKMLNLIQDQLNSPISDQNK
ncbi:MAG: AAA family ATPase [Paracoccaceae bacterium]|nr:AAA family ATPase [Paracoccaceae bacterium]MDE2674539.1 AAA family ATPase [Paracoccaceae bacterium]